MPIEHPFELHAPLMVLLVPSAELRRRSQEAQERSQILANYLVTLNLLVERASAHAARQRTHAALLEAIYAHR